jgi:hypothetical protein
MMLKKPLMRKTFLLFLFSILFGITVTTPSSLHTAKAASSNDAGYTVLQIVVGFVIVSVVISLIAYIILSLKKKV